MEPYPSLPERIGRVLFRVRSFTPVPVVGVILGILWMRRETPESEALTRLLEVAGILLAVAGQALRAWVLGQVPPRTSGQADFLEAAVLNTRGPYAHVRNPLYVGNFLLVAGLLTIANDLWAWLIGVGFFAVQYAFIVRAEEGFLRKQFGAEYEAWCFRVPRWIPRIRTAGEPLAEHFDARRALFKEHNPFAAWASGALALMTWKTWQRSNGHAPGEVAVYLAVEIAVLAVFVGVKGWKHGWITALRRRV